MIKLFSMSVAWERFQYRVKMLNVEMYYCALQDRLNYKENI